MVAMMWDGLPISSTPNSYQMSNSAATCNSPDSSSGGGNGGSMGYWKQSLYLLQERAPKPKAVRCTRAEARQRRPPYYGTEYHGLIDRNETERMLGEVGEGAYLVRESKRSPNAYTLCMLFDGQVLNYKLFYDGAHYVAEKRHDTLESLVGEGIICMFMEKHASEYIKNMAEDAIYEQSPYFQFNQFNRRAANRQAASGTPTGGSVLAGQIGGKYGGAISRQQSSPSSPQSPPLSLPARSHNFSAFTFKMPHYCDYCRNFLWGLVQQGMRCADCGFAAHKKCSERALHDCHPEAKYVKRMFAVDLTTLCIAHAVEVPPVMLQCIEEVESRGLDIEGIYRVPGSHEQMDRLRRQFDIGGNTAKVDLGAVEDIHTVASLLKLYLRLLPQQLVPFSVFRSLLQNYNAHRNSTACERVKSCRKALRELNEANLQALRILLAHLRLVSSHCQENKMSVENLATIFSPTIFCTGEWGTVPALSEQQHVLLSFLITSRSVTMY